MRKGMPVKESLAKDLLTDTPKREWTSPRLSTLKISETLGTKNPGGYDNESGLGNMKS